MFAEDEGKERQHAEGNTGADAEEEPEGQKEEVNVWKGKPAALEASRDEEFDEYFSGMFV